MIIGFIGVGKMATAIINGLNTSSHRIIISGSSLARSRQIAEELEVEAAASHQELLDNADLVILGIKPQMFDKVLADLNFHQPIISMAAGVTLERLASLTSPDIPLIRIMPNLNAQILKSTTGLCTNDKVSEDLLAVAKEIFHIGQHDVTWIEKTNKCTITYLTLITIDITCSRTVHCKENFRIKFSGRDMGTT